MYIFTQHTLSMDTSILIPTIISKLKINESTTALDNISIVTYVKWYNILAYVVMSVGIN